MNEVEDDKSQENLIHNDIMGNEHIEEQHPKNQKLPEMHAIINPEEKNNLITLDDKLNEEDYDDENGTIEIIGEKNLDESSVPRIIFNFKNYVFTFCLLFSSFLNYNFLYFPYIILGFVLTFLLFRNKYFFKFKKISELITMIYSILLLAFKIVFIILTKNDNDWTKDNKNIFINLGVKLLRDKDSTFYLVSSFLSESIIIVISLVSFIISHNFLDFKLEVYPNYENKTKNEMFNLLIKRLIINYIIFLLFALFNTSILTMAYLSIFGFILIFAVKKTNLNRNLFFFKAIILFNYIFVVIQIFFINLFNCYSLGDIIASKLIENGTDTRYYSVYTNIGIKIMLKNEDSSKIVIDCLSYFFTIVTILSISTSNYIFPLNLTFLKYKEDKPIIEAEMKSKSLCERIKIKIILFFTSPGFILHICRILAIGYLYYFRNFFAIIVFIWLFLSFLYLHSSSNKLTTYIVICVLYISYILFHLSNIDGLFEEEKKIYYHLSINKVTEISDYYLYYLCLNLFIFFDILFLFALYNQDLITIERSKTLKIKEEPENEPELEEKLIEDKDTEGKGIIIEENKNNEEEQKEEEDKKSELIGKRVTLQIEAKQLEEEKISRKLKINKSTLKKLTLLNIVLKAILSHIDKISLIAMYFTCINSINIIHMILVIIFMIQLLFPELIVYISKYLIMIVQVLYFIEFVIDIIKRYNLDNFNDNEKLMKLLMNYDKNPSETSVEIYFYIIVYLFYIQYKLYDHRFYKKVVSDDKVTLTNFILIKFHSHPKMRDILFFIGKIIIEIYIWILIILFIFFDAYFEISIIFEVKLILFFIIVYQFLISIQNTQKKHISLILNWIFLGYCSLNSFLAYGYQIICLDYFKKESEEETESNLPSIGFSIYKDKLYYRFLPHFVCNFISVLFLWEMKRILYRKEDDHLLVDIDKELVIEDDNKNEENKEEKEKRKANEIYEQNKKRMTSLEILYYLYNIILLCTKFYWLFLFIYLGIIFTTYDLSLLLMLYILVFGIIYIRMFYQIITKLNVYVKKKSFFISRLIRYNLIEISRHEQQNKYFREKGFRYLLFISLMCYILYYSFGIFHQVQNGCNFEDNNEKWGWQGCDNRHSKIINDDIIINSLAYLIGFFTECDYVFEEAWFHLIFSLLICFDVYVQKFEIFFNEKMKENRDEYKYLANQNSHLKSLTINEDNILLNINYVLNRAQDDIINEKLIDINEKMRKKKQEEEMKKNYDEYFSKLRAIRGKTKEKINKEKIEFKIDIEDQNEDERIGKKLLDDFVQIFRKSTKANEVKLSDNNNKYEILGVIKKVLEEIIIFLLICSSISKMDIWSFVYIIISLILITTQKRMIKFYILYCFLLASTLIQGILFASNIQRSTDPYPDIEILIDMNEQFNIPWYKNGKLNLDDKMGFFLGLGASRSQINLIWMEFIEIIIIYVYLDYFSYSIYQEENTMGRKTDKKDKISYYNLYINEETREISKKLSPLEYEKHIQCMKYNFDVDVANSFRNGYLEFLHFMETGILPKHDEPKDKDKNKLNLPMIKEEDEKIEEKKEIQKKDDEIKNIDENKTINIENEIKEKKEEEKNQLIISTKTNEEGMKEKKKEEKPSSFLEKLRMKKKKTSAKKKTLFDEAKVKPKSNKNRCYSLFKDFIYLSFHNVILIFIVIISMMISGLFSVFYIIFSLYFLITSTSIYLGNKYLYPRAIKTLLRVIILIDIFAQILYQAPFLESGISALEIIGLKKILSFTKVEDDTSYDYYDVHLATDQLILVLAKAFTYLVMSFQILVYSSQSFQEYYFSYIITKNHILRRISLMNVFKFNNNRIKAMNKSLNLRNDMAESMTNLEKILNQWNKDLRKTKIMKRPKKEEQKNVLNIIDESKELKEIEEDKNVEKSKEKIDITEEIIEEKHPDNKLRGKKEIIPVIKEEKEEKKEKEEEKKEKKEEEKKGDNSEGKKKGSIFGVSLDYIDKIAEDKKEEEDEQDKILPKEVVHKTIKDILLGGFLTKLYLKIYRNASSYMTIEKDEKDIYEQSTIKGDSTIISFLENQVEFELIYFDLSQFSLREMKEVIQYFDGTRQKKLKEKEIKEKKEKKKLEKEGKNILEKKESDKDIIEIKEEKEIKKKNNKKQKEKIVDLTDAKFLQLEKFASSKLYLKYLTKSYLIKNILKEIFSYFLYNFHWLCYLVMILNHIISASLLTLFYPISIFCYALLEYPRPSRYYWKVVLIYTVFLLVIKFVIHIEVLRNNESFYEFIKTVYDYKIGVKVNESSFSKEFFIDILYDALVIIFLLINDYLLVSRGVFLKREPEIESIYQANERIAKTNLIEIKGEKEKEKTEQLKETREFNNKYLEPKDYSKIEDKKNSRFNTVLITDEIEDIEQRKETQNQLERKPTDYNKLIKGYHMRLTSISAQKSINPSINETQKKIEQKLKELEEQKKKEEEEKKERDKYDESKRTYFERLFPKVRNEKPGNEFYGWYTSSLTLIIVYILLFYTTMINDTNYGQVELDTKQFSGEMVLVLLVHVAILVYDRVLYISQSRQNLQFEYLFYDKITGNPVSESVALKNFDRKDKLIPPKQMKSLEKKYNIFSIQKEEFNKILLQKYILHMVIIIISHLFIFFYCPMIGNNNIYGEVFCPEKATEKNNDDAEVDNESEVEADLKCNDFHYNVTLIIFYLIYIIYYISSGLQIKYGFYDMKRKSMLKSGDKSMNGIIYNVYKAIPFLYEIKLAIDWTFTKTCLDFFQWNKYESVYDAVYVTYCAMNAKNQQLVGQKIGKFNKFLMGGVLAFALILILLAPLMLFSSLNPTNKMNNLTGAELSIDLCFFYKNKAVKNYTLYQNTRPESIEKMTKDEMKIYNYSESSKTKNFEMEQVQTVKFFKESDKNWDLANPLIENLKDLIINRTNISELEYIALAIDYYFDRPLPVVANKIHKRYEYTIYYYNNYTEKYDYIENLGKALENCYDVEIEYPSVYSPPIRLSSNIKPKRLKDPKYFPNLNIQLGFVGCKNETIMEGNINKTIPNYLESYFTLEKIMAINGQINEEGIKFHVFSDKVSSAVSGQSILTLYISVVLLVGTYVRNFFAGEPEKIRLTEMPYSEQIINLCEGIRVSRNSFDFQQEERLYYRLIELMRSPEYLRTLTKSSTEQFRRRKEMTKQNKTIDNI